VSQRPGRGPLVVVGDALLDRDLVGRSRRLSPDATVPVVEEVTEQARPGGAGLAALLAARDGRDVVLVTALAGDDAGRALQALLDAELTVAAGVWSGSTTQKVRVRAGQQPLLRIDFGDDGGALTGGTEAMCRAIAAAGAVLVADYGRGVAADPAVRAALAGRVGTVPVVWDPHPRGARPVAGVSVATPNLAEARLFAAACAPPAATPAEPQPASEPSDPASAARSCAAVLRRAWSAEAVVVTLSERGALLDAGGEPALLPPPAARHGDPCGAGDRFSASVTGGLLDGASLPDAVRHAVAVAAGYVGSGGPADLYPAVPANDVHRVASQPRAVRSAS